MNFTEEQVISALASIFASSDPTVEIGIGDDAAVIATAGKIAITTDMAVEGTHFRKDWSSAKEIGKKITVANLADVYAMGATPHYLVVALSLTGNEDLQWVLDLARGIQEQAFICGASVVGGDLTRGPVVTISITAVGNLNKPLTRSGATIGDDLFISGLPGWSAAGLCLLTKGVLASTPAERRAVNQFRSPSLDAGSSQSFTPASSLCDISDCLLAQAEQLAAASSVSIKIDLAALKSHPEFLELSDLAQSQGEDVWNWILGGGEDHLFLGTGKDLLALKIGSVHSGSGLTVPEMKKAPDTWRHFS